MTLSRRAWLARSAVYGIPLAGFGYGSLVERTRLSVTWTEVPLDPGHAALGGLKLALMSDFHHDDFGSRSLIRRAVEATNAEGVDLVFLLGDYITDDASAIVPLCGELEALRPRIGTFGVMGNHDSWPQHPVLAETLEGAGVRLLVNKAEELPGFAVVGMDSHRGGRSDPSAAMRGVSSGKPVLLAWHEPDTFDLHDDPRVALQVSGHSHGGQICAPLHGPILLPEYGRKYPYGLYRRGASSLFVTRGIGTLSVPVRFLCPPELALLTLKA